MNKLKGQSMNNQRMFLYIFFVLTFFGVMNFLAVISSPAWANIRGVAVVRTDQHRYLTLEVHSFLLWHTFAAVAHP